MVKSILAVLLLASQASATPYFHLQDPKHPQVSLGAAVRLDDVGATSKALYVPIVTHSAKDGYLLVPGEDWAIFGVGVSHNAGHFNVLIGPLANVVPILQWAALSGLNYVAPQSFTNLKSLLQSASGNGPDLSISAGPMWKPPLDSTDKGDLRLMTAGVLHF